ncbi:MAG: hypothetical protein K0V04_22065 [Deltaproteobacteria bacterium]|nr:hypothetical protein [Deltaproteobacteria bacterium]
MNSPSSLRPMWPQTLVLLSSLALGFGCDRVDDADDPESLSLDSEGDIDADDEPHDLIPPQTAEAAGKTHPVAQNLTTHDEPVAALGWAPAVSEETPPATCDGSGVAVGVDCMGWHCDLVQMFCGAHSGTVGARVWTEWFSEEANSYRICPNTQWVTGVACQGAWCDDISLECTDLGLSAKTCWWSSYFGSEDPIFMAPTGHLMAGVQCKGTYCEQMRYFTCEV